MASALEVYEKLKPRLGDDECRLLLEFVQDAGARGVATREDMIRLESKIEAEIANLGGELRTEIAGLEGKMKAGHADLEGKMETEFAGLEGKMETGLAGLEGKMETGLAGLEGKMRTEVAGVRTEIAQVKADLLKWLFLFWAGQIAVIAGLIRLIR